MSTALARYLNVAVIINKEFGTSKAGSLQKQKNNASITMKRGEEITMRSIDFTDASIITVVKRGNFPHQDQVKFSISWEGNHDQYGKVKGSFSMKKLGFVDLNEFMDAVMKG